MICRRVMLARLKLEPSCTMPWTGMIAAGGMTTAMIASNSTPPPMPSDAVIADVTADIATSIKVASGEMPAGMSRSSRADIGGRKLRSVRGHCKGPVGVGAARAVTDAAGPLYFAFH
ncbi:hypothetical protein GCM10009083_08820 [Halopseudomonas pertucinogena]|uniref:Uncharacterized protein n=1 Tax=Halopseudomonas pertucinogena TaxID=86175 RepID=A0ABQ2CNR9_9GAMM|nr:hypothetical protein GCM10009083_08820 [Halopseudomonas pertucinogena]